MIVLVDDRQRYTTDTAGNVSQLEDLAVLPFQQSCLSLVLTTGQAKALNQQGFDLGKTFVVWAEDS